MGSAVVGEEVVFLRLKIPLSLSKASKALAMVEELAPILTEALKLVWYMLLLLAATDKMYHGRGCLT